MDVAIDAVKLEEVSLSVRNSESATVRVEISMQPALPSYASSDTTQQESNQDNDYAVITILGPSPSTYRVEYLDALSGASTNWATLTNVFVPMTPYVFVDTSRSVGDFPARFYRVVQVP